MEITKTSFWFVLPTHLPEMLPNIGWGNGYVAIYKGHPYWGKDYDDVPVDVHYGLTYAASLKGWLDGTKYGQMVAEAVGEEKIKSIQPDDWWVFGFDTLHLGDNIQKWPKEAVEAETKRLQEQLDELRHTIID